MNMFGHLPDPEPSRVVVWFSCGVTSAVAAKLALVEYPAAEVVRIRLGGELADNDRFAVEVAGWLGRALVTLTPAKYFTHFEVARGERYINGPTGAKCTTELKRKTRAAYQRGGDLHVFGFDAGEAGRVEDFRENNPDLWFRAPLIDAGLTKGDCRAMLDRAGILEPLSYRLGYSNANCIGCWKGGMGYWNRVRTDFPAVFAEAAAVCRELGRSPIKDKAGNPIMLDDLDPRAGRFKADQPGECGVLCESALKTVGLA